MIGPSSLDGKNILVTGAATGPGRVITKALASAGAHVVATDSSQEVLQAMADSIASQGVAGRVLPMAADLGDAAQCARIVTRAHLSFGALHGLINNACIGRAAVRVDGDTQAVKFWALPIEDWQTIFEVGARAAFILSRAAARYFLYQGWGRIVTVTAGQDAKTRGSSTALGPLNAALEAQAACWAADVAGSGMTVNVLTPAAATSTLAAPLIWLMSDNSDGFSGNRIAAARWDPSLPGRQAAEGAASPAAR